MQARRVLAIINPATGRTSVDAMVRLLREEARRRGIDLAVEHTRHPGHAVEIARSHLLDVDTIIAVGGDGTVSDVIKGTIGSDILIGIVPAGSTNIVARELGIPKDLKPAIAIAMGDGQPVTIDVARAGETAFIHMAGAGFDAVIMRDASSRLKRRVGWLAYIPSAVRRIRYPSFMLTLTIDGRVLEMPARLVLCAVGRSIIHPRFALGAGISRFDGVIDVLVFDPPGVLATLSLLSWIGLGRPERSRWLRHFRARSVRLDANRATPFEVDGDYTGELPIEMTMIETGARVLATPALASSVT